MATKETVFRILKEKKGVPVSGENLAEVCGVSRTAVWKAINSLRQEGFSINGTTNGGYILEEDADTFNRSGFTACYAARFPELNQKHIEFFSEIDSTNTYAKKLLLSVDNVCSLNGAVIAAESQTAGRGRMGRSFISPKGSGIYISVIYSPEHMTLKPVWISVFTAVAVCRTIKKLYGKECSVKWINDIYYDGRKICGILTEGFAGFESGIIESAVIGFGLNLIFNQEVSNGVKDNKAGALFSAKEADELHINRSELAAELAGSVLKILEEDEKQVIKEYQQLSFLTGKRVTVKDLSCKTADYGAEVVCIDDDARLVVKKDDGTICSLFTGEVSLKL